MTQAGFERFPFLVASGDAATGEIIAREKTFVATRRIEKVIEVVQEEEPPPPPTFSEEQMREAEEIGYRKGFDDGEKKGLAHAESEIAKIEQAALDVLPSVKTQMKSVLTHYNLFLREQQQALPKLALALAKKLYGDLPPEHLLEQLTGHVTSCLEMMLGEPELHVYVHPDIGDKMEERLAAHFANSHEPGDVLIHKDAALKLGDCRVEWLTGGMEYRSGEVLAKLETIVNDLSNSAVSNPQHTLINLDGDPELNDAVAGAIAGQLADDEIPPIPQTAIEPANGTAEHTNIVDPTVKPDNEN